MTYYECISIAKEYFNGEGQKYLFDELRFLVSDYSPEEYYNYAKSNIKPLSFKAKIKKIIKNILIH